MVHATQEEQKRNARLGEHAPVAGKLPLLSSHLSIDVINVFTFLTFYYFVNVFLTRLVEEISPRYLRLEGFFVVWLLNDLRKILLRVLRPTPVTMATKFDTKSSITLLV